MNLKKRSFLFHFATQYNIPNGDPFTGEPRYDNMSEKALVSDLRIKRYVRDTFLTHLDTTVDPVFVQFDNITLSDVVDAKSAKMSGAAMSFRKHLQNRGKIKSLSDKLSKELDAYEVMKEFLDVRLFGGILTAENKALMEGAVQFKTLNPSLNKVRLENFQNTTVFPSDIKKQQGSIGTSSLVPYGIFGVEGWLNEITAQINGLTEEDLEKMLSALWLGVQNKNSRSKSGQTPLSMFEIIYKPYPYKFNPSQMVYKPIQNLSESVTLNANVDDYDIRSQSDYSLDYSKLIELAGQDNVERVNYYTQDVDLIAQLSKNEKFQLMEI